MGLAWVPDDTGRAVVPASGREWNSGPRHRRPTLLARSGQAVACRITALGPHRRRHGPFAIPAPRPPARHDRPPLLGLARTTRGASAAFFWSVPGHGLPSKTCREPEPSAIDAEVFVRSPDTRGRQSRRGGAAGSRSDWSFPRSRAGWTRHTVRRDSYRDLLGLLVVSELRIQRDMSLQRIRRVVEHLHARGDQEPLSELRFATAGSEIYFQHPDGSWEGHLRPDQIVIVQVIMLDALRLRIRRRRLARTAKVGRVDKHRGVHASAPVSLGPSTRLSTLISDCPGSGDDMSERPSSGPSRCLTVV